MHDFTGKLRLLAEAGDAAALSAIEELDNARTSDDIRGIQAFEARLLPRAEDDFEFITPREGKELKRLGKDRNVCAHPSFQPDTEDLVEISPEQVRAYARLVADSV